MSVSPSRRHAGVVLLLAMCLLAVGLHFVGECFTHAAVSPLDYRHSAYDLAEDQFVLSSAITPAAASGGLWGVPPLLQSVELASIAPPVPPPDL